MRACGRLLICAALCCLAACSEPPRPPDAESTHPRVVTLAPNLTELVFAAGAGDTLVGVSAYSDFPAAAEQLPVVGDAFAVDQEQLAVLQPDLLLVWYSGTPAQVVDDLRQAGYRVEVIRTLSLADVATALRRIGELTGHPQQAREAAEAYATALQELAAQHATTADLRVFYQVDSRPLYTVNGEHYVSELIALCGGSNVFDDLHDLAPAVDVEAVLERDPEVILASSDAGESAFAEWERWPHVAANRYRNRFLMPADEIGRATPRLLQAATAVCAALHEARQRRATAAAAE